MSKLEALSALHKYMLAAGVYADMSNAELAAELLKVWGKLPSRHPLCALLSEIIERLDPSLMETDDEQQQ